MKNLHTLDEYRVPHLGLMGNERNGKFIIPTENGRQNFLIIASAEMGWDHVSVSLITSDRSAEVDRCPKWSEMCYVKDLFFDEDEVVMQLHPAKKDYVNCHNYTLHLWKPQEQEIPCPPTYMV